MSESTHSVTIGPGLPTLLTVLFTGLKLGHVIDWSWWAVTSPLWISALLGLFFGTLALVAFIVAAVVGTK